MKRRAFQIIVLLLFGAIVNVAVAWGCTLRRQSLQRAVAIAPNASMLTIDWHVEPYAMENWLEAHRKTAHDIHTVRTVGCRGLRIEQYEAGIRLFSNSSTVSTRVAERVIAGWPFLTLSGGLWDTYRWNETTGTEQRIQVIPITALLPNFSGLQRVLPFNPIWPGFAINTIFYAAVLWMMYFAPFALRRRLRVRRGLCPACAYPIASSPVCTECGATLPLPREGEGRGEGA